MRVENKSRLSPRGRNHGRALMAVAALAALLSVTSAQADVWYVQIVPELSNLRYEQYFTTSFDAAGVDGIPYPHIGPGDVFLYLGNVTPLGDYGQPNPSNIGQITGTFPIDINTGVSLKILPGASINYRASFPYYPYRAGGEIQSPFGGTGVGGVAGKNAQFGFSVVGGIGIGPDQKFIDFDGSDIGLANIYDFSQTFGSLSTSAPDGGALMPNVGGNNYAASDLALIGVSGVNDIWSSAVITSTDMAGIATPIGGNFGGINNPTTDAVVTWDGSFLTIPINNRIVFVDDGTLYDITTTGQIVVFCDCPEPSSIAMLSCGAIGLVGQFVRTKRKSA